MKRLLSLSILFFSLFSSVNSFSIPGSLPTINSFNSTWTILGFISEQIDDLDITVTIENLTVTAMVDIDLNGVFTVLEEIQDDIFESRTITNDKFNSTWTILEEIEDDIFATRTILCDKFVGTWTILEDIEEKLNTVTTAVACFQSQPISGPVTISQPGTYCLVGDISGELIIASSDVTIDMQNFTISSGTTGIQIGAFSNIVIKNGIVRNATSNGIQATNSVNIKLLNITLENNDSGILLTNVNGGLIQTSLATKNNTGIELNESSKLQIVECTAQENMVAGFSLQNSNNNIIKNCSAIANGTNGTDNGFGFVSDNGSANIFENCNAQSTITTQTGEEFIAAGFAFTGSETCSKIIECESFDNTTSTNGFAIPYGILLTSSFIELVEINTISTGLGTINTVDWSPNGKFLAIGDEGSPAELRIYALNTNTQTLSLVDRASHNANIRSVKWSPNGNFIALGGSPDGGVNLKVYSFSQETEALTFLDSNVGASTSLFNSIAWSFDSKFIAGTGRDSSTGTTPIQIFLFNGSTLTFQTAIDLSVVIIGESIDWIPNGNFFASSFNDGSVRIFSYDRNTQTITQVDSVTPFTFATAVNWSFDGKFLATGGSGTDELIIYSFDQDAEMLTQVASEQLNTTGNSVSWSPDGNFIGTGDANDASVFSFNRVTFALSPLDSTPHGSGVQSVNWSNVGSYFALGGNVVSTIDARVYTALTFPTNNIIKNNIVYCNTGNQCPSGFGIAGSSLANLIVGNTAYDNTHNYAFVGNVASNVPTLLENISVNGFGA